MNELDKRRKLYSLARELYMTADILNGFYENITNAEIKDKFILTSCWQCFVLIRYLLNADYITDSITSEEGDSYFQDIDEDIKAIKDKIEKLW